MEMQLFFVALLFGTIFSTGESSGNNGYYYPPTYGNAGDNSVVVNSGYQGPQSVKKPQVAQKFEVHVYEVGGDAGASQVKSDGYTDSSSSVYPKLDTSPFLMYESGQSSGYDMTRPNVKNSGYDTAHSPSYPAPMPVSYEPPKKIHKTKKCFQCEYRPPRPETYEVLVRQPFKIQVPKSVKECKWEKRVDYVYKKPKPYSGRMYGHYETVTKWDKVCIPKTVYETRTKYRNRYISKKRVSKAGGFEACRGPIDAYSAKHSGVDDWDCYNNCFIKLDKKGTISRGCYSGQYKVDPNRLGCHYQGDNRQDLYCFCEGDRCNGQEMPTTMSNLVSTYS